MSDEDLWVKTLDLRWLEREERPGATVKVLQQRFVYHPPGAAHYPFKEEWRDGRTGSSELPHRRPSASATAVTSCTRKRCVTMTRGGTHEMA
jgi:hypothetical protein